jgi:hypothetical protein
MWTSAGYCAEADPASGENDPDVLLPQLVSDFITRSIGLVFLPKSPRTLSSPQQHNSMKTKKIGLA